MGAVSLKVGVVKQKNLATLCAPNNANPPFQNPGSATERVPYLMSTPSSVTVKSIGGLPIPEEYLGTAELKRLQGQRGQNMRV